MRNDKLQTWRVARALLWRDITILKMRLKDDIIDAAINIGFYAFLFGFLGVAMGLQKSLVAITFLGTIISTCNFIGFSRAITDLVDRSFTGFLDYRRILPLSAHWLFFVYLLSYCIHMFCVTMPLLIVGYIALGFRVSMDIQWQWALLLYPLIIFAIALFFVCIVFSVSFDWFKFNIWDRILTPIQLLGCQFYAWQEAYFFSPRIALFILLNPYTYYNEGLRSAVIGNPLYIASWICLLVVIGVIGGLWLLLTTRIYKKLDWI